MSKKYATFADDGKLLQRLDNALHEIPAGAVELDAESWLRLTQETDGVWFRLSDGRLKKEPVPGLLSDAEMAAMQERAWRDAEVAAIEWLRDRHRDEVELAVKTTLAAGQYTELLGYLQDLRNWPQRATFPVRADRPVAPGWLQAFRV